jgi:hypothetical protein
MRVTLLFMVLGGIFTIGAAYIHDTNHPLGSPRRFGELGRGSREGRFAQNLRP